MIRCILGAGDLIGAGIEFGGQAVELLQPDCELRRRRSAAKASLY